MIIIPRKIYSPGLSHESYNHSKQRQRGTTIFPENHYKSTTVESPSYKLYALRHKLVSASWSASQVFLTPFPCYPTLSPLSSKSTTGNGLLHCPIKTSQ